MDINIIWTISKLIGRARRVTPAAPAIERLRAFILDEVKPMLCKALGLPLSVKPSPDAAVAFNIEYGRPPGMAYDLARAYEAALWFTLLYEQTPEHEDGLRSASHVEGALRLIHMTELEQKAKTTSQKQSQRAGKGRARNPVTRQQLADHRDAWKQMHGTERGWMQGHSDRMKNACETFLVDPATIRSRMAEK